MRTNLALASGEQQLLTALTAQLDASDQSETCALSWLAVPFAGRLAPTWQAQQEQTIKAIYGAERVLLGKRGFDSLAHPQKVLDEERHV